MKDFTGVSTSGWIIQGRGGYKFFLILIVNIKLCGENVQLKFLYAARFEPAVFELAVGRKKNCVYMVIGGKTQKGLMKE